MNINLKKVISSVAALAMSLSCFTAFAADFTDVEATASYKAAIDELVALEIVNGYEDGSFKPENEITRAEVTKMVVAAMGDSYTAAAESSKGTSGFADVDAANHWASGFISVGVAQKFINGMGDGTFAPDSNVTYAQIVKMLVAALGYDSAAALAGGYPNGYLQIGAQIGVTAGVTGLAADTAVTRANVAQLISNAIDTPLVVVTGWSQNYVTGEPIAETDVMDGTEGKAYKTLLTENHNAYVVKGRVTATFATGGPEVGTVDFDVEYADNFDGKAYEKAQHHIVAYVNDTAAEDLLFTYAEALIAVDENDEYTILTITPYGRNEIVELAADDYDTASTPTLLQFAKSATSTKTDKYEIAADAKLYVNGACVAAGDTNPETEDVVDDAITADMLEDYIENNEIGIVTLINSPAPGSTSLDRKFDIVMVTYPKWAIVDEALTLGETNRIIFQANEDGVGAVINMDTTDEDAIYTFYKNGEEIAFEDIAAGDVALLTYDFIDEAHDYDNIKADDAGRIVFEFCDAVVEGMVTGKSSDNKYTVNGEQYELLAQLDEEITVAVGNEYSFSLDAAGRVIKAEELSSAKNYGVIDRVSYSTNEDAYVARIIKADGTRENVAVKTAGVLAGSDNTDTQAFDLYNRIYNVEDEALENNSEIKDAEFELNSVANRVVSYKINSKGELNSVAFFTGNNIATADGAYKESSMKLDGYRISEATAILDATKVDDIDDTTLYTASDLAAGSTAMFVDGEDYVVVLADKGQDGCFKFALVLEGNATVNINTGFAVVDMVASAIDEADGEVKKTITVLDANSQGDLITYFVDEDIADSVDTETKRGTVVALGLEGDVVVDYTVLFDEFATDSNITFTGLETIFDDVTAASDPYDMDEDHTFFITSGTAWDTTHSGSTNGWARTGFGMILNKKGSTVTLATGVDTAGYTTAGIQLTKATNYEEFDLDSDVNVYVVDMNYADKQGSGRISIGSVASVMKTPGVKEVDSYASFGDHDDNDETADKAYGAITDIWSVTNAPNTELNVMNGEANYAYFKVVDGDITDIVVFIPAN